jgi:hypothetical protein
VTINTGATLAPGTSPGILTIQGSQTGTPASAATATLNLASGSKFALEIGGLTAGTQYDQVNLIGNASVTGSNISISIINGYNPAVGSSYTVLNNDGSTDLVLGQFTQGTAVTASNGQVFTIDYTGGDGNDIVLTATAIPEPGTWAMMVMGIGLLLAAQKARRRNA